MVQQIVSDMSSHDCSYCHGFVTNTGTSSHTIVGKQLLRDLQGWLTPPDPSTNHNTASGLQQERTADWVFSENIYREWELSGSLLWIHGKGMCLYNQVCMSLTTPHFRSGLGEEHPLVRLSVFSLYAEAYVTH